jgi:hypothetical protein
MTSSQTCTKPPARSLLIKASPSALEEEKCWAQVSGLGGRMAEYLVDWLENNGYERRVDWSEESRWTVRYRPTS